MGVVGKLIAKGLITPMRSYKFHPGTKEVLVVEPLIWDKKKTDGQRAKDHDCQDDTIRGLLLILLGRTEGGFPEKKAVLAQ